ncbi:hypothetical protein AB0J82_10740 [Asanoa sp. NPDC049518]|uniref:hypothetical protein n=1 Tax=unclassified Asanoa TaxID=2685164 RepID=UPI0034311C67
MRPDIPFRVIGRLGACDIGSVWLAVDEGDEAGNAVTVAVLDEAVAADQQWRDAFAASTTVSTEPEQPTGFLRADFTGATPWVAYPGDQDPGAERVFVALGRDYRPDAPREVSYDDGVFEDPPPIVRPANVVVHPAEPTDPMAPDPFAAPGRRIAFSATRKRRPRALWVSIAAAVVVVLAAGGVVFALAGEEGGDDPAPTLSGGGTVAALQPTSPPVRPGIEPPRPGDWPDKWPVFGPTDPVRPVNLDGLGFTLTLPARWDCAAAAVGAGSVRYNCGRNTDDGPIGGELTVRNCTPICDEAHRDELRSVEDAWGAQWRYAGPNATLAETLTLDGDRYGLVVIGYWAGTPGGAVDRQVVLRMTAPRNWVDDLRRLTNGLRGAAKF